MDNNGGNLLVVTCWAKHLLHRVRGTAAPSCLSGRAWPGQQTDAGPHFVKPERLTLPHNRDKHISHLVVFGHCVIPWLCVQRGICGMATLSTYHAKNRIQWHSDDDDNDGNDRDGDDDDDASSKTSYTQTPFLHWKVRNKSIFQETS
jgi:hypothetical protein